MNMKKYAGPAVAAVMFIVFLTMYLAVYRHVIIFHEQHHLFRFSLGYIAELAHWKGPWEPAVEFMAQFGYYPWLAALLWSALLTGVYLMSQSIIRRLTGLRDLLQVSAILPCWMFFQTVDIDGSLAPAIKALAAVTVVWLLVLAFGRYIPRRKRREGAPAAADRRADRAAALGPVVFAAVFGAFWLNTFRPVTMTLPNGSQRSFTRKEVKTQKVNEALMVKAVQAMRRKDWDEVIDLSERQAETGTRNHLMSYFRAMALYHKGQLLDRILDLPQHFGPRSLFFPWKADKNQAEYGGYVYEQLGALNSATHWEFEALVGWGETAHHLINLSRYLIETGRGEQARKFIAPLHRTLFYRSTARQLDRWLAEGDVPDLRDALKDAPQTPMRADNVLNIGGDTKYILMHDPTNEMARQYLMLTMLLANNLGAFYRNLREYYPPTGDGARLPRLFEEALCLVRLNYGSDRLAADGYHISPETDAAYRTFLAEKNKDKFANFTAEQKRTYWYYVLYVSPEGNQLHF